MVCGRGDDRGLVVISSLVSSPVKARLSPQLDEQLSVAQSNVVQVSASDLCSVILFRDPRDEFYYVVAGD